MKIVDHINQKNNKLIKLLNRYRKYQIYINVNINKTEVIDIERDHDEELLKMM